MPNCAECVQKPCRTQGDFSLAPSNCPTVGVDEETTLARYTDEQVRIARCAAAVEGHGYGRLTRVEEIMDFAMRCGYHKLGLAFCAGFSSEGATLSKILRKNGFEVVSVCCKNGSVPKRKIGIPQEDQVRTDKDVEIMCNPAGQAALLNEEKVDLALVLGLCVGHDTIFLQHIQVPTTYVAVKDRATGHNPLAAIYCSDGYLRRVYKFVKHYWSKDEA